MRLEQREERVTWDQQALRRFECNRAGRIRPRLVCGHGADGIAGTEELQDHIGAARRRLEDLHASGDDGIQESDASPS